MNEEEIRAHLDRIDDELLRAESEGRMLSTEEAWARTQARAQEDARTRPLSPPGRRLAPRLLLAAAIPLTIMALLISPLGGIARDAVRSIFLDRPVASDTDSSGGVTHDAVASEESGLGAVEETGGGPVFIEDEADAERLLGRRVALMDPILSEAPKLAMIGAPTSSISVRVDREKLSGVLAGSLGSASADALSSRLDGALISITYAPSIRTIYGPKEMGDVESALDQVIIVDESSPPKLQVPEALAGDNMRRAISPYLPPALGAQLLPPAWPSGLLVPPPGVEDFELIDSRSDGDLLYLRWRAKGGGAFEGLAKGAKGRVIQTVIRSRSDRVFAVSSFAGGAYGSSDLANIMRRLGR